MKRIPLISTTSMLVLVRQLRWKDIKTPLRENPGLIEFRDKKGTNWLHLCCSVNLTSQRLKKESSIRTAEVLLRAGLDINQAAFSEGKWKATSLWYAIAFGRNLALANYLLKGGSDPNHCLRAAAYNDDADAIRLLIRCGAEITSTRKASPFLAAIRWGRFAAAEELLKLGADVNCQDSKMMTALHYVLRKGNDKKSVRMLIRYGARGDIRNGNGATAADIMLRKREPEFREMAARLLTKSRERRESGT